MRYGINILNAAKLRQEQMTYLLDNMVEPEFITMANTEIALANEFNIDAADTLNTVGITYRIMNHQGFGNGRHDSAPSYGSVAIFMNSIQSYFPKSMQVKYKLWSRNSFQVNDTQIIADDTKELLDEMIDWLIMMKQKIEDKLSENYFISGKMNLLEILKRRYKNEWTEKIEQSVEADVKADTTINITFEDA